MALWPRTAITVATLIVASADRLRTCPRSVLKPKGTVTYTVQRRQVSGLLGKPPERRDDARLLVTVIDDVSRPIAGANVALLDNGNRTEVRSGITDATGVVVLSVPSAHSYRIVVHVPGYYGLAPDPDNQGGRCCPEKATLVVTNVVASADIPIKIRMAPLFAEELPPPPQEVAVRTGVLRGRIVTTNGEPVAGARVEMWRAYSILTSVRTNREGLYHAVLPAGEYRVEASGPPGDLRARSYTHYKSSTFPVPVAVVPGKRTRGVDILLIGEEHFGIHISVVDGVRQKPAAATITMSRKGFVGHWKSGPNGAFDTPPVGPGPYTIFARGIGEHSGLAAILDVEVAAREEIPITLLPGAQVKGQIQFQGRERPLHSGAWPMQVVTYKAGHETFTQSSEDRDGVVDGDGWYALDARIGEQCVTVLNLPGGWKLGTVTYGGRDVTDAPIAFVSGESSAI
jgi:hypothetical protein